MTDVVECRSDNEYAGRPRALYWEGQRLEIESVLTSWRTPQGKCFRVRLRDGREFELDYNEMSDGWTIENR